MDAADRRKVIAYYRGEILQTSDLIGREPSSWLEC